MRKPDPIERRLLAAPTSARRRLLQASYALLVQRGLPLSAQELVFRVEPDGAMHVLAADLQPCGICGREHALFVSRGGTSRCWECDRDLIQGRTP